MKDLKIGLIARADDSGLGTLCWEFYNHLPFFKVLIVYNTEYKVNPERFGENPVVTKRGVPDLEEIDEFLKGLDLVLTFETPYNWNLLSEAKKRGIKTILVPNYEWTPETLPIHPDLFICGSKLDYDEMPPEKVFIPIPIDRKKYPFKLRKKAETFVFNNGHGGYMNRNSSLELFQAISMVKKDVKFLIRSQVYFKDIINDSRVKVVYGDLPYNKLYSEGDVFIYPHKYSASALPIQEATSAGMPVITTKIYPHDTYLPKEWLFEPETLAEIYIKRKIKAAIINPVTLAKKIEEWAHRDIEKDSKKANEIAEKWSWKNLKPKYLKIFKELCQK